MSDTYTRAGKVILLLIPYFTPTLLLLHYSKELITCLPLTALTFPSMSPCFQRTKHKLSYFLTSYIISSFNPILHCHALCSSFGWLCKFSSLLSCPFQILLLKFLPTFTLTFLLSHTHLNSSTISYSILSLPSNTIICKKDLPPKVTPYLSCSALDITILLRVSFFFFIHSCKH